MAFFNKKKLFDVLGKEFKNNNTSYEVKDNKFSFEINCSEAGYNLYPYIKYDENDAFVTIVINIRQIGKENVYEKLNNFNLLSRFFTMKLKDNVLYLEGNIIANNDTIYDIIIEYVNSIKELQFEIEKV